MIRTTTDNNNECISVYDNEEACTLLGLTEDDLCDPITAIYDVTEIYFRKCNISTLPDIIETDLNFQHVELISLNYCGIKNISRIHFAFVDNLVTLKLSHNEIESLDDECVFNHISTVEAIFLDYNRIATIHKDVFSYLFKLEKLLLNNNRITFIASDVFDNLHLLQLHLDDNKLEDLSQMRLPNVQNLSLAGNYIKKGLPFDEFSKIGRFRLRSLDISRIFYTVDDSKYCDELKSLQRKLSYHYSFMEFPKWTNECVTNEDDSLWCIGTQPGTCTLIVTKPSDLDKTVRSTNDVTHILIYGNIPDLPEHIHTTASFTTVKSIDISLSNITHIPKIKFDSVNHLRNLFLNDNNIQELNAFVFNAVSTVWNLDLGYNQITNIHRDAFHGLTHLRKLSLEFNRLTHLDPVVFQHLPYLHNLKLDGNELDDFGNVTLPKSLIELQLNLIRNMDPKQLSHVVDDLGGLETLNVEGMCYKSVFPTCCYDRKILCYKLMKKHVKCDTFFEVCYKSKRLEA